MEPTSCAAHAISHTSRRLSREFFKHEVLA
jgi:hypothetical protein